MMFYPMFYFDPIYVLILTGVVISMAASAEPNSAYQRYSTVRSMCTITGAEATRRLLADQGVHNVTIRHVPDNLIDCYDLRSKTVNLSDAVYNSTSIIAVGVAAHRCGHAMQDTNNYFSLRIRATLMSVTNPGSQLCWPLIIIGLLLGRNSVLSNLGILLFCLIALFQPVTLPVEYDAPHRAANLLDSIDTLVGQEVGQTGKVLNVAAPIYVAAAAASILQLFRPLILFGNRRSD